MSFENLTTIVPPQVHDNVGNVSFSWYDYILFSIMLAMSVLIGIYFGCFGSKQSTAAEYLMGNKKMKVFPISVSVVASHVSGITLLAVPADIYRFGASWWLFVLCLLFVSLATIYVYLPVFHKLGITSVYEYLERRFDSRNRICSSFLFALGLLLYLPIVIYIPALAFSAATGINVHYVTPVVCGVCIFYTTLGGLKAVVWTDTLQFIVTSGAVFTVVVIGVRAAGGLGTIFAAAYEGHRLDIFNFDPDPTQRDTFWTVMIGISTTWLSWCSIHQSCVQKFLSLPTFDDAKRAVIYFCIGYTIIGSCSAFIGLIMYARYAKCDPFSSGAIEKGDQLLPYYVMDVASHIPGLSGLFIAGIFCAALSTLSASLNCLAGTVFEDFILKVTGPMRNEKTAALVLKMIVVVSGLICTSLVFLIEKLGGIFPLGMSLGSVSQGPLLGMFTLGILFPKASSRGTFYGTLYGLLFSGWLVVMVQYYKSQGLLVDVPKPISTENCPAVLFNGTIAPSTTTESNFTTEYVTNFTSTEPEQDYKLFVLFRVSYYYFLPIGCLSTIVASLFFSYILTNDDPPVHKDLLSPVIHSFLPDDRIFNEKSKEYHELCKALTLVTIYTQDGVEKS